MIFDAEYVFEDGTSVHFGDGKKDSWCVFIRYKGKDYIPLDKQYFNALKKLGNVYGMDKVYDDFLKLYNHTTDYYSQTNGKFRTNELMFKLIHSISTTYQENARLFVERIFAILYMAMIAEYHYICKDGMPSKLNKRIKLLGVHRVLKENIPPEQAANESRNKTSDFLNALMIKRGI